MKNKSTIGIIILVLSLLVTNIKSQIINSGLLMETKNNELTKEEIADKYSLEPKSIKEFYPVNIDAQVLIDKTDPSINIGGNIMSLKKTNMITRGQNSFSYTGIINNEKSNRLIITVKDNFVVGTIYLNSKEYSIVTFKDMNQYMLRVEDNSTCGTNDDIPVDIIPTEIDKAFIPGLKSVNVNSSNMRIIVLYTPDAESYTSDILTSINSVIYNANVYLANSLVDETWELAYVGLTNYTESTGDSRYTDNYRFRIDGDGYMDEVHDLREKYSADVCVLVSECQSPSNCGGIAATIDANTPSWAFCLVHIRPWGEINAKLFCHEIGHLLACRHQNDPYSTPYAYGHGLRHTDSLVDFQTIMGTIFNLDFAPNFSNPDVCYKDHATGTSNWNDCSRVLETEIPEKTAFLQPENNVTISSTDIGNINYGDVISEQTVTIQNATIPNGSVFNVRSGETTISSNFTVELGAELYIKSE